MTTIRRLISITALSVMHSIASATDLEVTIRPHTRELIFGDCLYVEVKIANRGKEPVSAQTPSLGLRTFDFRVFEPSTELEITSLVGGGFSGSDPVRYDPGSEVMHYWMIFVPSLARINHPFWNEIKDGKRLYLSGLYSISKRLHLRSNSLDIHISGRKEVELKALDHWAKAPVVDWEKGPMAADFGLKLHAVNRRQTLELAAQFPPGEIRDLLDLTLQLQELYQLPPSDRTAKNRILVEWLQRQPDIKREALTTSVRSTAEAYNLQSTATAIKAAGIIE